MKALRTLIIDDERLARRACRHLLETCDTVEVVGEASSLSEAKRLIDALRPDLILLDIEMPGGRGIDLLDKTAHRPRVILVTAYEAYALEAFDLDVVDYVLKPIDPDRLRRALARVASRAGLHRNDEKVSPDGVPAESDEPWLSQIGSGNTFVDCEQVLAVFADGNYTHVLFKNQKEEFVRQSMRQWEEQLNEAHFLRLNRKMIINVREISTVKLGAHGAQFTLNGCKTRFSVGRSGAVNLKRVLEKSAV
ncbi:MAG: response regulator transcription factor [Verrucomicrobia bacterium]|nr:response regulator transcription factor [Verrucomicrobiota bacterium]MCH8528701.1 response regulator transcription factor [Kiritimatiellia bacterium]